MPYFYISKYVHKPIPQNKFTAFFQSFPEKATQCYCFEEHLIRNKGKDKDTILRDYLIPNLPQKVKDQILRGCKLILEKDEIPQTSWDDCNMSGHYVSMLLEWIPEAGNAKQWMIKLLKIFLLGMLPDFEKRKSGIELRSMIYNHFYDFSPNFISH